MKYILQEAKYVSCPKQRNCYDCSLFRLGTMLHAIEELPIDDMIFDQEDITLFRQDLYNMFTRGATSSQNFLLYIQCLSFIFLQVVHIPGNIHIIIAQRGTHIP
jgi:hypothetical protein